MVIKPNKPRYSVMKKYSFVAVVLLLGGLFTGCTATIPPLRLTPIEATNSTIIDGRAVAKEVLDSIQIVASFDGVFKDYAVFDIEIFNLSNQPVMISPANFRLVPLQADRKPFMLSDSIEHIGFQGAEPAQQVVEIENQMVQEEKKIKRAKVFNTILFVGGIVLAATSDNNRSSRRERSTSSNLGTTMMQASLIKRDIDHVNFYSNMDRLDYEKNLWKQQTFNTNIILPHASMRGNVFVPCLRKAAFMKLVYPVQDKEIQILFQQTQ